MKKISKIIGILTIILLLSSCGSSGYCVQNEWSNPLSKQYSKK